MSFSIFSERRARAAMAPMGAVPARVALTALLALAPAADALAQCAMCAQSAAGSRVSRGLSLSILFLLSVLVLTVGWFVSLVVRRGRAADERELTKGVRS